MRLPQIAASCIFILTTGALLVAAEAEAALNQRRISFNQDWRFFKGDPPGAQQPAFNDSRCRSLELPHDWAIEGPFDRKYNPHNGALPFYGVGWYRKRFRLPAAAKDRHVTIEFDGAMSNSQVWLNGRELGGRPYGYIGFVLDLTRHLEFSKDNVLAVRLAPEDRSSRWYPGAGIYRNVWLHLTAPVHVANWGTYITTPKVSDSAATIAIRTEIQNHNRAPARIRLETTILDAAGKEVARTATEQTVPPGSTQPTDVRSEVARPQRWDIDRPYLYQAVSTIRQGRTVLDRYITPFGIRTIAFDKTKGFSLNGRPHKMQGVCMHHDLGALGAAVNRRATQRQLEIMKRMGVNAIRTSHNPPSPELLEFCDRLACS
jgi:beta-galactosidase